MPVEDTAVVVAGRGPLHSVCEELEQVLPADLDVCITGAETLFQTGWAHTVTEVVLLWLELGPDSDLGECFLWSAVLGRLAHQRDLVVCCEGALPSYQHIRKLGELLNVPLCTTLRGSVRCIQRLLLDQFDDTGCLSLDWCASWSAWVQEPTCAGRADSSGMVASSGRTRRTVSLAAWRANRERHFRVSDDESDTVCNERGCISPESASGKYCG